MTPVETDSVTVTAVENSVRDAVATGRIGQPVNVRLHWQAGPQVEDIKHVADTAMHLAESVLGLEDATVTTRPAEGGELLHALMQDRQGRSALISVCAGKASTLSLTVYGNHGVIRLEETVCDSTETKLRIS